MSAPTVRFYTTAELAALLGAAEQTPRASLCRTGSWMGLRPIKLPNGKLLWPADQVESLLKGGNMANGNRKNDIAHGEVGEVGTSLNNDPPFYVPRVASVRGRIAGTMLRDGDAAKQDSSHRCLIEGDQ